jgi:hypothetical protein
VWQLALPDPRSAVPTLAAKIRFVAAALAKAAFGTCEDEQVSVNHSARALPVFVDWLIVLLWKRLWPVQCSADAGSQDTLGGGSTCQGCLWRL